MTIRSDLTLYATRIKNRRQTQEKNGNPFHTASCFALFLSSLFLLCVLLPHASLAQNAKEETIPLSGTRISKSALDIWNDPSFQKQFAESYKAETEIEPTVTVPERETMQEILDLMSNDKMDEAAKLLQQSLNEAASAVFDFTLANIYFQQEKLDAAAEAYKTAVEKFPQFRRAWKNLALIHVRQTEYKKAIPALTRVIELGGSDYLTYGLLGYSYSSVENYLSAESAYRMAILLDPDTLDWKMGLARCFFKQQRFGEAVALCNQLIKDQPDNADLWLLQANAYIGMKEPLEAAEIYELVDRMGKSSADSLNMLGDIYINEELYGMAAKTYIRAMQKDTDGDAERAIRSAKILAARAAYNEAKDLIKHIQNKFGDQLQKERQIDLLKVESRIAVAEGSAEEEVDVLKEIVELDPLDGEALILLGQYHQRNGNDEQAIFYYERAAGIEAYEAEAKVRHAQLLVRNGNYDDAIPLLRQAQQVNPRENVQKYLEQVERIAKTR